MTIDTIDTYGLVLCRSDNGDGGWSLHPFGSTDSAIASGAAPAVLSGFAEYDADGGWNRPNQADYDRALASLPTLRSSARALVPTT